MLNKIFGCFFGKKKFKDKLLNKIIAISLVLFQAVFLLILLDSEIFKVSAEDSINSTSLIYFTSPTETVISGEKLVSVYLASSIITENVYLKINDATTYIPMVRQTNGTFTYTWNTKTYPNGYYTIQAIANYQETHINSNILSIYINNPTTTADTFKIDILSPAPMSTQTSDIYVKVSSNFENVGLIDGKLLTESDILIKHFSLSLKDGYYQAILPIFDITDGNYKINIAATLDTSQTANSNVNFKIQKYTINDTTTVTNTTEIISETETLDDALTNSIATTDGSASSEIIYPAPTITTASALEDTTTLYNTTIIPSVKFVNQPLIINGSIKIKATTTFEAEEIIFIISGPKNANFDGTKENTFIYSFYWNIDATFPEGNYTIKVNTKKDGQIYSDEIKVNYTKEDFTTQSENDTPPETLALSFVGIYPTIFSNDRIVNLSANKPVEKIEFFVSGPVNKKFYANTNNNLYYFTWPTKDFPNGKYKLSASAMISNAIIATSSVDVTINNIISDTSVLQKPIDFSESNATKDSVDIGEKSDTATSTAEKENKNFISEECKKIGITGNSECIIYKNLDPLCKNKEIKTLYQCNIFLNLNLKCRELNLDESTCNIFLRLPVACQNANILNREECKKYLYAKSLPPICVQNNITNHENCNNYLTLLALPAACVEAEAKTKEECRAFLLNQELTLECKNAGIVTNTECKIYLTKLKQNTLCASLGINNDDQCLYYFQNKTLARDCLDMGIKNESDCNALLLKKYSQQECGDAGIENEYICALYIFNKYQTQINCGDFSKWQCQEIIETKYLGNIVYKQTEYNELKLGLLNTANKKILMGEFESELSTSKNLVPLVNKDASIKIVRLEENMLLSSDETLIQTSPVAIIIDSDGDGLSDDTEKRIGTDANNYDSDNDGYSDGEEVKNNFNPLGQGLLSVSLAPIDWAIANGETLEQPKTSGELSDNFTINKLTSSDEKNAYIISGQADPDTIVTLYLYSDMPLLVTARTDEFGNWQYELQESLIEGEHEIYAAINDNTGRITKKSNPINFFIREAKAVSIQDFVASAPKNTPTKSESMLNFYFIVSLIIVFLGISLFIVFILLHKNKKEIDI